MPLQQWAGAKAQKPMVSVHQQTATSTSGPVSIMHDRHQTFTVGVNVLRLAMSPEMTHMEAADLCNAFGTGGKCMGMGKVASALQDYLVSKHFRVTVQLGAGDAGARPPSF